MQRPLMRPGRGPVPASALPFLLAALAGCASVSSHDLVPPSVAAGAGAPRREGSVEVRAMVWPERADGASPVGAGPIVDGRMLRDGLKESIERHGPFAQVREGGADYVLDVWVDRVTRELIFTGEGYVIDLEAIWRLTRVRDGEVVACEGVKGHGGSHAFGTSAARLSMATAIREMVQRGLAMLSDTSAPHLSAMSTAGLRPSMGQVVPAGLVAIMERVRQNWPKLSMGMTVEEVERLLGPVTSASSAPAQPQGHTQHFSNGLYALAFIDGRLSFWELRRP